MIRVRSVLTGVAGSPWYSNLYFQGVAANAQDATDKVRAFWGDYALTFLAVGIRVDLEAEVATIDQTSGDIIDVTPVAPGAQIQGLINGEKLPPMTQYCLNLRTGDFVGGREIRGKFFAPGFTINHNDDNGRPTADVLLNLRANVEANLLETGGNTLVVWSRKNGTSRSVQSVSGNAQWSFLSTRRD